MELQNRVAVVTGGAARIGRELCLRLAAEGMRVCLHYWSSADEASETAAEIRAQGGEVVTVQANLAAPLDASKTILSAGVTNFGRVDVLINNASIFEAGSLAETSPDDWRRHQAINLEAPLFLCQEFARQLKSHLNGAIVNLADWRAERPQPGHLSYTISKAGIVCLTKVLAQELAPQIRVNAIAPGAILPPADAPAEHEVRLSKVIPLHRSGSPANITQAVLFLLQNDFVNGEILHVTGGQQLVVPTG